MGRTCFPHFMLGAMAMAAIAGSASAEVGLLLAPASEWQYREYDDRCRASRQFGEGENRTTLWIEQGGAEARYNLTFIGRPFRHPFGGGVHLQFGDQPEIIRSYIAAESSRGRPVLMMYGVSIAMPELERGEEAPAPDVTLDKDEADAIDHLRMRTSIVEPVELQLGSLGEPHAFLNQCGAKIAVTLSEAGRALTSEAQPPVAIRPDRWLRRGDYPVQLAAAGMAGQVTARITVNSAGKPSSCFVTETNKPNLFDDTVCLALMKRAEFEPARDASGEPVASYYFYSVNFQIG